jgi:hypothetical protein
VQVFNTRGAVKEPGEPNHAGEPGGASMWYAIEAAEDGVMEVSTEGSEFDTVLAVYGGPPNPLSYDELTWLADDNNSGSDGRTSKVLSTARKGQVYHVAVDGVKGASGRVVLSYRLGREPVITQSPSSQTVIAGGRVAFEVGVTNRELNGYRWWWAGVELAGMTNGVLELGKAQWYQAGAYTVEVRNWAGWVRSSEASLTVVARQAFRLEAMLTLTNGVWQLSLHNPGTTPTVIEASTNLIEWVPVFTNLSPAELLQFADPGSTNVPLRFYRAVAR